MENPFFVRFINELQPSYKILGWHTLSNMMLLAEDAHVFSLEKTQLKNSKKLTYLVDGWDDLTGCSIYASMVQKCTEPSIIMNLEDMTGKHVDAVQLGNIMDRAMAEMDISLRSFLTITTDNPKVMQKFQCEHAHKAKWIIVSE